MMSTTGLEITLSAHWSAAAFRLIERARPGLSEIGRGAWRGRRFPTPWLALTGQEIFIRRGHACVQMRTQFWIRAIAHLFGRRANCGTLITRGTKYAIKAGGRGDIQGLRRPIPVGRKVSPMLRIGARSIFPCRPWPMFHVPSTTRFPGLFVGKLPNIISGRNGDMGWTGATGAVAHFRALRHVSLFCPLVRPRARSSNSDANARVAFTLSELYIRRLVWP